jgi:signal peptidase II
LNLSEGTRATIRPNVFFVAVVALIIFIADQLSKSAVLTSIGMGNALAPIPALTGIFTFVTTVNTGTACGYFPQLGIVFTFAPLLILGIVIYFYSKQTRQDWMLNLATGLIVGGALGNLTDRFRFGYVVDFIQILRLPVFNVADAAVSTALVVMLFWMVREDVHQNEGKGDAAEVSLKVVLPFIGLLAIITVLGFFVCVYLPANLFR